MRKRRWRMARKLGSAGPARSEPDLLRAPGHRRSGNEPLDRAGIGADRPSAPRTRVAEALDAAPGLRACRICGRAARGFLYTHRLRADLHPTYAFCSRRCQDAGAAIARILN